MNPKPLRYFLLAGVILIWGIIIFRVINGINSDDPVNLVKKRTTHFSYDNAKDSFLLLANYPDPFIPEDFATNETEKPLPVVANGPVTTNNITSSQKKPEFDIQLIQYHGMIANPERKIKLAVVTLGGREFMAKVGEKIDNVRIRRITRNDIVILADGKSYTIPIKTN